MGTVSLFSSTSSLSGPGSAIAPERPATFPTMLSIASSSLLQKQRLLPNSLVQRNTSVIQAVNKRVLVNIRRVSVSSTAISPSKFNEAGHLFLMRSTRIFFSLVFACWLSFRFSCSFFSARGTDKGLVPRLSAPNNLQRVWFGLQIGAPPICK